MEVKKYMQRGERRMQKGDTAYILFNKGYTYERKERRKTYIHRRKMLMNEQQETFNQQQGYYRGFFYKSKANNFQI